jgi:hypothetical protein
MKPAGRLLSVAAAGVLALGLAAVPAAAASTGDCTSNFNGIEAARIDSLASPLLLSAGDALVFGGTDPAGTQSAALSVFIGPVSVGHQATSSPTAGPDFLVSLDLADVARYGVGLLRVEATTDNCTVEAWLRLGGRQPLTTLVGLTGLVLGLLGLAGQVTAWVARRRWSLPLAGGAGVATGAGFALVGQELGRLQLSYLSLGGAIALAVLAGLAVALALRPHRAEPEEAEEAAEEEPAAEPIDGTGAEAASAAAPATASAAGETRRQEAAAPAAGGPFWCYVMSPVEVLHLDDYSRVVATLVPGNWYLAKREMSGWAQVVAAEGVEGWVPRQTLHRQG